MNDNLFRRVNWLWKHRHTHDGDPNLQEQITIIRTQVEGQGDTVAVGGSGAYIHLTVSDQTIAVGGENVAWSDLNTLGVFGFQPTFPTTTIEVLKSGYYNLAVPILKWSSWTLGGSVSIWRNDIQVWPLPVDTGWSTDVASVWRADAAHAVWFDAGDTFRVFIDHGDTSSQVLAHAAVSAYLVDRAGETATDDGGTPGVFPFVVGTATSNHNSAVSSHIVALPSGINNGDLLVACLTLGTGGVAFNTPTGWTFIGGSTDTGHTGVWAKVADGTEGGSQTFTSSGGTARSAHITHRIIGHFSSATMSDIIQAAWNLGLDPPLLGPTWGTLDILWITVGRTRRTDNTLSAPTDYIDQVNSANPTNSTPSRVRIATATRDLTASSEDPDTWTKTGNTDAINTGTVAIRPA